LIEIAFSEAGRTRSKWIAGIACGSLCGIGYECAGNCAVECVVVRPRIHDVLVNPGMGLRLSEVQWSGNKSSIEVVGGRPGCEDSAGAHKARLPRYVRLLLPWYWDAMSRSPASFVGNCGSGPGRGAGAWADSRDSPDALLQSRSAPAWYRNSGRDAQTNPQTRTEKSAARF